ncbi:hypothetical protein [Synechococcus sp. BA-132 BA5]|uniref:hypothetical protein n=1 Tax=Synechococcus sp. BA-132 BA5 TaxID=3110252 RepID=UPI002B1EF78F|nr:hypothetical protein [Synechococcus sp. BA-132 BA5]MEA5415315.1 hypothetical protein [Synechococcus sp. BA-132 BA5]
MLISRPVRLWGRRVALAGTLVVMASAAMAGTAVTGMFTYMADAASIRLCATGQQLPVAMEGDFLALQRAYLQARPADQPGQPLFVELQGRITQRPSMEPGQPPRRTLVVETFKTIRPGQECPAPLVAPLRGTDWRLQPPDGRVQP